MLTRSDCLYTVRRPLRFVPAALGRLLRKRGAASPSVLTGRTFPRPEGQIGACSENSPHVIAPSVGTLPIFDTARGSGHGF